MKRVLIRIVFVFCMPIFISAQEINNKKADSILEALKYAFSLNHKSEHGKSIEIAKQSLDVLEGSNRYKLLGMANNSLAYSYAELKDKTKAFEYSFKARDYYIKSKDTLDIMIIYNDIGVTYEDFDMIDEAYASYKDALKISDNSKYNETKVYANSNIADILIDHKKEYRKSLIYSNKALNQANTSGFNKEASIYGGIYLSLGFANYKLKRFKESEDYYNKAYELAHKAGYLMLIEELYKDKSLLFKEDGKYDKALEMMDKYIIIHDSINKTKNLELANTIDAKYKVKESEKKLSFIKKEQEIQEAQLAKSNRYNILLALLSLLLLLAGYWVVKRNKQLQEARDVAENLSRVKSNFYSEISHELRTPLYGVIELSNILLNENTDTKNREYLESLKFSGGHLLSLINNVLELNKIESEQLAVEELEFNLKVLITNIIDSLEYSLRDSKNQIKLNYDESISTILVGDSLKLSQLLINLISNAVKFTKNGLIEIEIKQVKSNRGKEEIYFEIKDNGIGIPKEKQKYIFEDFYQERSRHDNSYKGTGLGLSIVKRLLTIMGSDISIESELNKGTKFYFNLSFHTVSELTLTRNDSNIGLNELKGKRFLIVDDNKINQLVTKKLLQQLELDCDVIDDGFKAIEIVKEKEYDCILMDINMPRMNGYEASQRIRHFNQDITIVALTAATSEEVKRNIVFYDMDGYVLKPFYTGDFIKMVSSSMRNRLKVNKSIA